jgi:protein-disulfide isomerase
MEQSSSAQDARRRRVQLGVIAFFLAAAAIAGLIALSQSGGDGNGGGATTSAAAGTVAAEFDGIAQSGTVLGDPAAKVTVVEYGDLQCPICRQFSANVTPDLIKSARAGDIKLDFQQWLIIGPDSKTAGAAALAAGEQDRYWQFITAFYENQGPENGGYVTPSFLQSIAEQAGVPDLAKWKADSSPAKWASSFAQIDATASKLGFTGTPSVLVKGPGGSQPVSGSSVPSLADVQTAIAAVK